MAKHSIALSADSEIGINRMAAIALQIACYHFPSL
jgi:hypothetical protein